MAGISRRDFLDGIALGIGAGLTPASLFAQGAAAQSGEHPPSLTGWRGGTPAAYAIAHGVRDGARYAIGKLPVEELYDLVVVGAGISGLTAAHAYRKRYPRARVLILENHDEFGGHARRNEFELDGRLFVGYGGSESIQSPEHEWSEESLALLAELGVDLKRFEKAFHRTLYPDLGLSRGLFFTREAFGVDKLVTGDPTRMVADDIAADRLNARAWKDFIADYPLESAQQAKLLALCTEPRDVFAGKSLEEKAELLGHMSYREFIQKHWGLDDTTANSFHGRSLDFFACGIDGVAAIDARDTGYPGFQGLGFERSAEEIALLDDPYINHFPDGNSSIARLLVRKLIPGVAPGSGMHDIVSARFDYARLDLPGSPVRLRLGATVVNLRNRAYGKADIGYVREGRLHRVQAGQAIYSGYASMLPYICADVSGAQKTALAANVKAPLVYVNVLVRNWKPWAKLGVHEITNPMGFFSRLKLDYPVSLGNYHFPTRPEEPMVLHLVHVPSPPPGPIADLRAARRAARAMLYTMTLADFEARIRDELTRMLGAGGFDAQRDIAAITVNRWGHGYAYEPSSLYDTDAQAAALTSASRRIGRIGIAGSDAGWGAYAPTAIDEALRAVAEIR
jgi:spermidine dehydrogenase